MYTTSFFVNNNSADAQSLEIFSIKIGSNIDCIVYFKCKSFIVGNNTPNTSQHTHQQQTTIAIKKRLSSQPNNQAKDYKYMLAR